MAHAGGHPPGRRGRTRPPLVTVLLLASACASVETGPPRDVAGTWMGQCQNCPVQAFTLVMKQDGAQLSGTLQASGRTGLGERPMPLRDGKVAGRRVTFQTTAADGIPFQVDLTVSEEGKTLDGHGHHRAVFPLSFIYWNP